MVKLSVSFVLLQRMPAHRSRKLELPVHEGTDHSVVTVLVEHVGPQATFHCSVFTMMTFQFHDAHKDAFSQHLNNMSPRGEISPSTAQVQPLYTALSSFKESPVNLVVN